MLPMTVRLSLRMTILLSRLSSLLCRKPIIVVKTQKHLNITRRFADYRTRPTNSYRSIVRKTGKKYPTLLNESPLTYIPSILMRYKTHIYAHSIQFQVCALYHYLVTVSKCVFILHKKHSSDILSRRPSVRPSVHSSDMSADQLLT